MNIPPVNPENNFQIPKTRARHAKTESPRSEVAQDSVKTESSYSLMNALHNDPDLRPGMVDHGKRLAADPNYPPAEMISDLAKLFIQGSTK